MQKVVGILAGGGSLPGEVAQRVAERGDKPFIVGFEGFAEPRVLAPWPHCYVRLGAVGRLFDFLRKNACQDIVLIGPVKRPSIWELRPDKEGTRILARLGKAFFLGDDGLLGELVRIFEEEGFKVKGAHEYLDQHVGSKGVLGRVAPDETAFEDIALGIKVVTALGQLDVGQSCVVQSGVVLAVEAMEGTDRMLARAKECRQPRPGGVLVKIVKPGQEKRTDMPTIGPLTVTNAISAGLRGIAFEAGGTLFADKKHCIKLADDSGLYLIGVDISPHNLDEGV